MHDPMLLTDEHCAELAAVTNRCINYIMELAIPPWMPTLSTSLYEGCPDWLRPPEWFTAADMRATMTTSGAYSDWPAPTLG